MDLSAEMIVIGVLGTHLDLNGTFYKRAHGLVAFGTAGIVDLVNDVDALNTVYLEWAPECG